MKKLTLLIICTIISCNISAQQKNTSIGIKAGLNISSYYGKSYSDIKAKVGYQAGVVLEYRFFGIFALSPELVFSAEGCTVNSPDSKSGSLVHYANYINLPVMAKFYVLKNLSIDFGPQFGLVVYMHETFDNHNYEVSKGSYDEFNVGLGIGATYNFNKNLFVQGRYNMDFLNMSRDEPIKPLNGQLCVGYKFFL